MPDAKNGSRLVRIGIQILWARLDAEPQKSAGTDELLSWLVADCTLKFTSVRVEHKDPVVRRIEIVIGTDKDIGFCGRNAFRQLEQRHILAGCKYLLVATPSARL